MRLVVDASVLVAEVLRARGRALLAHPRLDLVLAADTLSETEHELRQRVSLLVQLGHLEATLAERLLDEALACIFVWRHSTAASAPGSSPTLAGAS